LDLTGSEAEQFLRARREGDIDWFLGALRHPNLRPSAVQKLGELGAVEAIPKIIPLLHASSSDHLRRAAAHALGQLQAREALEPLFDVALRDTDQVAREWALFAIGCIGLESDDMRLRELARDSVAPVRVAGIAALLTAKSSSLSALGVKLRGEERWKLRRAIDRVCRRIKNERPAVDHLASHT
jgi:HEAT repeat protein